MDPSPVYNPRIHIAFQQIYPYLQNHQLAFLHSSLDHKIIKSDIISEIKKRTKDNNLTIRFPIEFSRKCMLITSNDFVNGRDEVVINRMKMKILAWTKMIECMRTAYDHVNINMIDTADVCMAPFGRVTFPLETVLSELGEILLSDNVRIRRCTDLVMLSVLLATTHTMRMDFQNRFLAKHCTWVYTVGRCLQWRSNVYTHYYPALKVLSFVIFFDRIHSAIISPKHRMEYILYQLNVFFINKLPKLKRLDIEYNMPHEFWLQMRKVVRKSHLLRDNKFMDCFDLKLYGDHQLLTFHKRGTPFSKAW